MKWVTVQEYAIAEKISLPAAYKRIKEKRAKSERRYGKLVVKLEKEIA
jgi:hypothetical protein